MTEDLQSEHELRARRLRMVEEQIRRRGVQDTRILNIMSNLPREQFLPEDARAVAYEDRALPIGHGQTISQPYIAAFMTEQLAIKSCDKVLEIGTGSGYQTAILALVANHVYSIERIEELRKMAITNLSPLQLTNVTLSTGDGSVGLAEHAPYDKILAAASAPAIPDALLEQLADGGTLIMPIGNRAEQTLVRAVREGRSIIQQPSLACRFVKLIGKAGWHPNA